MRLEYPMYSNGMYCLKTGDFDNIANMVLSKYLPNVLKKPQPVDIDYLIEDCLYLSVIKAHITLDGHILGMMVFEDVTWPYYDMMYHLVTKELKESTMLIDLSLRGEKNLPRERFTKAHEASHWICHRSYHSADKTPYEFRTAAATACRDTNIERYDYSASRKNNTFNWEEWQADRLAASLLMPKNTFMDVSQKIIRSYGIHQGILIKGYKTQTSKQIISTIAETFLVSQKATQIRLNQLGLLVG